MNHSFASLLLALLLVLPCSGGALAAALATAPAERYYRLALVGAYPDNHPVVSEVILPWLNELAEKTRRRLVITYYNPNVLLPENTHFEALRKRNVPLAMQSAPLSQGKLTPSEFLCLPGGPASNLSSSRSGTAALWRMYRNTPELRRGYEELKLLSLHGSSPVQLHLNFQLKEPGGLKGKRILCADSYLAAMLREAAAIPLILPESAHYLALAQGKAEGVALPFDLVLAYGIEQFPFIQSVCVNLGLTPYWLAMNKADWNSLPPEYQRILEASSSEGLGLRIAEALDTAAAAGQARMAGRGVQIKTLSATEAAAWREALAPAARALWLENMKAERFPDAQNILNRALRVYQDCEAELGQ